MSEYNPILQYSVALVIGSNDYRHSTGSLGPKAWPYDALHCDNYMQVCACMDVAEYYNIFNTTVADWRNNPRAFVAAVALPEFVDTHPGSLQDFMDANPHLTTDEAIKAMPRMSHEDSEAEWKRCWGVLKQSINEAIAEYEGSGARPLDEGALT